MSGMTLADTVNQQCLCRTLEPALLRNALESDPSLHGLADRLALTHPHLFSQTTVFVDAAMQQTMVDAVAALHRVTALPAYVAHALAVAPESARHDFGPAGVFMGYDFHLGPDGPRLIEVNTNAGGALLNAALARATRRCCGSMQGLFDAAGLLPDALDDTFVAMFRAEWAAQRGEQPWRTVLVVDDAPDAQYLAPEFALAQRLFTQAGLAAAVADPRDLLWRDGALWHPALPAGQPVDLVYNRITDFALAAPEHQALQQAYQAGAVVLTPHPRVYALQADKRNLVGLSDPAQLAGWGASAADSTTLQRVLPRTVAVTAENAATLWAERRGWFFKPIQGFGARGAYRGDKLTRRVWQQIGAGGYVAQELVPPSERLVDVNGTPTRLKLDLRAYAWRGQVQLLAARTWSGQTTNFRTDGGGFAPVVMLPTLHLSSAATPSPAHCPSCA